MHYKAQQVGDSWTVFVNGIAMMSGLTEHDAKRMKSDFQREADNFERVNQEDEE